MRKFVVCCIPWACKPALGCADPLVGNGCGTWGGGENTVSIIEKSDQ